MLVCGPIPSHSHSVLIGLLVIPVPETSNTAAATLASKLGKPYVTAFM